MAAGRAGSGLAGGVPERRGLRPGRRDGHGCRGVWRGALAGGAGARAARGQLPAARCAAGAHFEEAAGAIPPLGIPCLRDRMAQTAAMLVLVPLFEADLQPEQHAYRAGRSALDVVQRVHRLVNQGHREIVDRNLSHYFGEIPHAELLRSVARAECLPQEQCADGIAVRAGTRAGGGGTPEPSAARLGEPLLSGAGESGLRRHRRAREQAAASVAVSEAQGEVREIRALPGREVVGGLRLGTPECAEAQLRVSEGMISNESRVRKIRTLGSMSGERKRVQGGE